MPPPSAATTTTILAISMTLLATSPSPAAPAPPPPTTTTVRAGFYLAAASHLHPLVALDTSLYTHLYYSALPIHPTTHKLVLPTDPDEASLLADFSPSLKSTNPTLRTLLSIGSLTGVAGSKPQPKTDPAFAAMAADPSFRASLAAAALALSRNAGFDVAWRFPSSALEMANFGFLLAELRAAAPPGFLLTAAAYFSSHVFSGVDLLALEFAPPANTQILLKRK
ncbi:unnamed protein product [Urochloa humidicola]